MSSTNTSSALTILTPLPTDRPPIRAIVFDFDGTISTLRQGWEPIMSMLMVEMIAGPSEPTPALCAEVEAYIDHSTGIQTIHQMVWLAEAVVRYGLNPEVHDAWWYKAEYNRRLMEPVLARVAAIAGDLPPHPQPFSPGRRETEGTSAFMVAGSRAFLEALRTAGIALYVASGTDHPDVVREVSVLGLTDFFVEIAGAPVGAMDCSKEAVLRRLVQDAGLTGLEVAVIGDGRVEIALGREVGAITLGVATDEVHRAGINPVKYARLERAGAHAITGDFSAREAILAWLGVGF